MIKSKVITSKVAKGFVSKHSNLGIDSYDLNEWYSPDTVLWRSKVLDFGSPKYPPQVATAPARYWFDRSRYNNHGIITGAIWKRLSSGLWYLWFDGSDDKVAIGANNALNITGDMTLSHWLNLTNVVGTKYTINCGQDAPRQGYYIYISGGQVIYRTSNGVTFQETSTAAGALTTGKWLKLTVTRSGAVAQIYLAGVNITATSGTHVNPTSYVGNKYLGIYADGAAAPFAGGIALPRVLNVCITPIEVLSIYNRERYLFGG